MHVLAMRYTAVIVSAIVIIFKVFIIMHEYVNKIICILSYDKIQAFIWYQVFKSRIFSSLDIRNC